MNSMILSSLLAVWAWSTGTEGNRVCSSSALDTGQSNSSDTRWLVMSKCSDFGTVEERSFCEIELGKEVTQGQRKDKRKNKVNMQTTWWKLKDRSEEANQTITAQKTHRSGCSCSNMIISRRELMFEILLATWSSVFLWGNWSTLSESIWIYTCFHGRGRHRRQSCSAAEWGQSWLHSLLSPGDHSGNISADGILERHSEHSTRPRQTPDQDWTSPEDDTCKHICMTPLMR